MTERTWATIADRSDPSPMTLMGALALVSTHVQIENRTTGDRLRGCLGLVGIDADSAEVIIEAGAVELFGVGLAAIGGRSKLTRPQSIALGAVEQATARSLADVARPVRLACVLDVHVQAARSLRESAQADGYDLRVAVAR